MKDLWLKLLVYRAERGVTINDISLATGITRQTICGWKRRSMLRANAIKIEKYTKGVITLKDCGH